MLSRKSLPTQVLPLSLGPLSVSYSPNKLLFHQSSIEDFLKIIRPHLKWVSLIVVGLLAFGC